MAGACGVASGGHRVLPAPGAARIGGRDWSDSGHAARPRRGAAGDRPPACGGAGRPQRCAGARRRARDRQDDAARVRGRCRPPACACSARAGSSPRPRCRSPGLAELLRAGARRPRPDPGAAGDRPRRARSRSARDRGGPVRDRRGDAEPAVRQRGRGVRSPCSSTTPTCSTARAPQALLFAARRLLADPIALVLAVREGEPSLLDGADLRMLRLGRARPRRRRRAARRAPTFPTTSPDGLYRATGGNPLALLELAPEGARIAALPSAGPVPISTSIAAAFLRRFERLPEPTRRALVLAAASDAGDLAVLARAATALGLDVGDARRGRGGRPRHARRRRGRVQASARPVGGLRRRAGAGAARRSTRRSRRRCPTAMSTGAHGTSRPRASARTSRRAPRSSRPASVRASAAPTRVAAAAFERGAGLAPADDARGRLLFAAADAAWLGGDLDRAVALLDEARLHATERRARRPGSTIWRGLVAMRRGPVDGRLPAVVAAAERDRRGRSRAAPS